MIRHGSTVSFGGVCSARMGRLAAEAQPVWRGTFCLQIECHANFLRIVVCQGSSTLLRGLLPGVRRALRPVRIYLCGLPEWL
jgi:hypothetical protein